jgi:hypothetical protein
LPAGKYAVFNYKGLPRIKFILWGLGKKFF